MDKALKDLYYTTGEVAALYRVDSSTVSAWIKKGWFDRAAVSGDNPVIIRTLGPDQGHYRILKAAVRNLMTGEDPASE
jgi:hypothetical protein